MIASVSGGKKTREPGPKHLWAGAQCSSTNTPSARRNRLSENSEPTNATLSMNCLQGCTWLVMAGNQPRGCLGRLWDDTRMPAGTRKALGRLCDAKDALREQIRQLTHSLAVVARGKELCPRRLCHGEAGIGITTLIPEKCGVKNIYTVPHVSLTIKVPWQAPASQPRSSPCGGRHPKSQPCPTQSDIKPI